MSESVVIARRPTPSKRACLPQIRAQPTDNKASVGTQIAIEQRTVTVSSELMLIADLNYDECDRMQQTMQQQMTQTSDGDLRPPSISSLSPTSHPSR